MKEWQVHRVPAAGDKEQPGRDRRRGDGGSGGENTNEVFAGGFWISLSATRRELFFGVGDGGGPVRATVRWPSGLIQKYEEVPVQHRIEITEEAKNSWQAVRSDVYVAPEERYRFRR
jgi:hypothetical protein